MIIQLGTITTLSAYPDTLILVLTLDRVSTIVISPENMFAIVYSTLWMHMYLSMFRQTVWCLSLTATPFLLMSTSLSVYVNQCTSAANLIFVSMITSGLYIKFTYEYSTFSLSTALKMDGNTSAAKLMTGHSDVLSPPLEMVSPPDQSRNHQHDPGLGHDDGGFCTRVSTLSIHVMLVKMELDTDWTGDTSVIPYTYFFAYFYMTVSMVLHMVLREGLSLATHFAVHDHLHPHENPLAPLFDAERASALDVQTSTAPVHNVTTVGQYRIYHTMYRTDRTILVVAACLSLTALHWVRRAARERMDVGSKLEEAWSSSALRFLRTLSFSLRSFSSTVFPHKAVKISLSPFEVAKTLHYSTVVDDRTGTIIPYSVLDVDNRKRPDRAPQSGSNLSADELVKILGSRKVRYGEVTPNILGLGWAWSSVPTQPRRERLYD
ncbi:hypothetical protein AYO21_09135 [Fonsecaea monophora]|uniref:Uncharacterized protein n=1 Tax=Fonsecaea monophora TaxID=254056 RepID=A0A177EZI3_9EURO|nr:hypothetical protein AYO21_09135 [Fonsecaea monophora]OAG36660.1 hypothetical protein AYO21_09135 [Fonsecaea monophora]